MSPADIGTAAPPHRQSPVQPAAAPPPTPASGRPDGRYRFAKDISIGSVHVPSLEGVGFGTKLEASYASGFLTCSSSTTLLAQQAEETMREPGASGTELGFCELDKSTIKMHTGKPVLESLVAILDLGSERIQGPELAYFDSRKLAQVSSQFFLR